MKKIATLFQRNFQTDQLVRNEVTEGCEWVLQGEGEATRKLDGSCCMIKGGFLYRRYTIKKNKQVPKGFEPATERDPVTGKQEGWIKVGDSPQDKYHCEAFARLKDKVGGTYELVGPKVQGNPEKFPYHCLVKHGAFKAHGVVRTFEGLRGYLAKIDFEGIVFWRDPDDPDCDKAKIKKRDFGIKRGV